MLWTVFVILRQRVLTIAALLLLGTAASAETVLTPFAGVAFGGANDKSQGSYGGSLAFFGQVTGLEVEFGITPHFFGDGVPGDFFTKNDVVTLTGNLLVIVPAGEVRFYGVAGGGLMKTRLEDSTRLFNVDSSDFGINLGGGLIAYIGHTVGLRADIRYFRSLSDLEGAVDLGTLDYWRAVGGVSLRF
jgi:hypothetical protein